MGHESLKCVLRTILKVKNDPDDPHLEFKGSFDGYIKKNWVKFLMIDKPEVGQKFLSLVIYLMVLNLNERTCKVECDKSFIMR